MWTTQDANDYDGDGTADILFRRTDNVTLIWGISNSARTSSTYPGGLATEWEVQ